MRKSAKQDLVHLPTWDAVVAKPDELSEAAARAAAELMEAGQSGNTMRSYAAAWKYWNAWFEERYQQLLTVPVAKETVVQFIVDHAGRTKAGTKDEVVWELPADVDARLVARGAKAGPGPMAMNTLRHRLSVLSKAHEVRDLPNPVNDPRVRELVRRAGAAYKKRGALPSPKPPLRVSLLEAMVSTCDDSPAGVRDRALLLFAFASGGRRRSEVVSADMSQLEPSGFDFSYNLAVSKSNQAGAESAANHKPVTGEAARALRAWLELCASKGKTTGRIFRRLHRFGAIGEDLSEDAVNQIVKYRVKEAAKAHPDVFKDEKGWKRISAHSLRSGFVSEAGALHVPMLEAMAMTGHKSPTAFMLYNREAQKDSPAARVYDEVKLKAR